MDFKKNLDLGRILTIAGCIATLVGSLVAQEQQKRANHEIAVEVAEILRAEMRKEL